jgi:hypothetical protein
MRVVTWHDGRGRYPAFARKLSEAAERFEIPARVVEWEPENDVGEAQKLRLRTIRKVHAEHPDSDLLVLDADCDIVSFPVLLDGVRTLAFPHWTGKWFSGVWYLPRGQHLELVEVMELLWEARPRAVERDILNEAMARLGKPAFQLPPEYWWIEPMHRKVHPESRPVIEHYCVNMGGMLTVKRRGLL